MKEAISNSFLTTFILVIIVVIIALVAGSLSYTKAFKVKNRIINIIENSQVWDSATKEEVDLALREIGYRVNVNNKQNCPQMSGKEAINTYGSSYRYCIYQFTSYKGNYYGVVAYMYFDFPIIGQHLELPVRGQTKIFYDIDNEIE